MMETCYPASSRIVFEFPEFEGRPALKVFWYDGGRRPSEELMADLPKEKEGDRMQHYSSAALIVGDKGKFYSPGDYGGENRNTGLIVDGEFIRQRNITRPAQDGQTSPFLNSPTLNSSNRLDTLQSLPMRSRARARPFPISPTMQDR